MTYDQLRRWGIHPHRTPDDYRAALEALDRVPTGTEEALRGQFLVYVSEQDPSATAPWAPNVLDGENYDNPRRESEEERLDREEVRVERTMKIDAKKGLRDFVDGLLFRPRRQN